MTVKPDMGVMDGGGVSWLENPSKKKAAYFRKRKPEKYNSSESWTVLLRTKGHGW
jgi:hypothetical protein